MQSYSENILQTLTGKSSLNDVGEDELKHIAEQYPYFSAAQFLVAKKLFHEKNNYKPAAQKAAVHFADVLWFHYNFLEEETTTIKKDISAIKNISEIDNSETNEVNRFRETTEDFSASQMSIEVLDEPVLETEEVLIEAKKIPEVEIIEPEYAKKFNEANEVEPTWQTADIEILDEPVSETEITEIEGELPQESNEKLSSLLKEQAAAFEKPIEETTIPIEPTAYHRIDYFDSQGIRLDPEKANDKLGSQMKRFTEWLKQMKRISPNLTTLETDAAGESQVQNMAEHSNEPKEIVTEAMAEVLIMQNKPEQAIQIYEKLSFFNPSKSAYFAAKIQELKA